MVYVLSENGQPLMPTVRHGSVRRLLKSGKARVFKRFFVREISILSKEGGNRVA